MKQKLTSKQILLLSSLVGLLLFVLLINNQIMNPNLSSQVSGNRTIASTIDNKMEWQEEIVTKISEQPFNRKLASVGKQPSSLDHLQFGLLEGKYALHLKESKIMSIEFTDEPNGNDRPKYIERASFINEYKTLFPIEFQTAKLVHDAVTEKQVIETYGLFDSTNTQVGVISFKMDTYGRFISLNVE